VTLNDEDWDLGSAGPVKVPDSSLLFAAGKPASNGSFGDIMRIGHLGGIGHGAFTGGLCTGGGVFGSDATDVIGGHVYVYAACGGGTVAVEVNTSAMTFKRVWAPSTGSPDGPPVVAGGLVWALDWNSNVLYGMNATNGDVEIQRSTDGLDHFATPAVGDARVFVPTDNGVEAWTTGS
jgi:outer membrane protein assembly factor BamB